MNAWLITWEYPKKNKSPFEIAAILSSRRSDKTIVEFVELLYLRTIFSAYDMAYYANRPKKISLKSNRGGIIMCGHNDYWLYARVVTNLRIQIDEENDKEIISWIEPSEYKLENYQIVETIEGQSKQCERKRSVPLSKDIW